MQLLNFDTASQHLMVCSISLVHMSVEFLANNRDLQKSGAHLKALGCCFVLLKYCESVLGRLYSHLPGGHQQSGLSGGSSGPGGHQHSGLSGGSSGPSGQDMYTPSRTDLFVPSVFMRYVPAGQARDLHSTPAQVSILLKAHCFARFMPEIFTLLQRYEYFTKT